MLVLGSHTWEVLQHLGVAEMNQASFYTGRLGVLLFFVHTAFVLMASLERSDGAPQFFIRRGFRIYPLAITCVLLVIVLHVPTMPMLEYVSPTLGGLASNLALTQILSLSTPVITPLWSLPIELQMYAALPVIFLWSKSATNLRWIVALWIASIVGAFVIFPIDNRLMIFQFAPCFMGGVVAYALSKRYSPRLGAGWWLIVLALAITVYISLEAITPGIHHRALQAAICLAVGVAIPFFRQSSWTGLNRCSHVIAKYSYGIYLFHVIALWLGFYAMVLPIVWGAVAAAGSLVALSFAGYHLIERPMMRLGARVAKKSWG